jgi:CBS domain-containing protein
MRAIDVMTTEVIAIEPTATVQAVAALLSERGISGVPVVDAERHVIGIVSEGDLLHRAELGTERRTEGRRPRWFDGGAEEELARDYAKSHARMVKDVMSRDVISVSDTADLADVAMLLETKRIKRVPVIRDGVLVGIISRANLVRAFAATKTTPASEAEGSDSSIRAQLIAELRGRRWSHAWPEDIIVKDRVVHLWVSDDRSAAERQALRIAAENTVGVQSVEEHLVPAPPPPVF